MDIFQTLKKIDTFKNVKIDQRDCFKTKIIVECGRENVHFRLPSYHLVTFSVTSQKNIYLEGPLNTKGQ